MTTSVPPRGGGISEHEVLDLVDRWVADGLVAPRQARRMYADLELLAPGHVTVPAVERRAVRRPGGRGALVVEALGYVGGAIVVAGTMLIGARYWGDLAGGWRLGIVAAAAVLLVGAGALVPARDGTGRRLRAVLWLAGVGASSGSLAVLATDVVRLSDRTGLLVVGAGTAAVASALWLVARTPPQQVAMMAALALAAAALVNRAVESPNLPGLAVWGLGVVWAVLAWGTVLSPPALGEAAGALTALFGAVLTSDTDAGTALAVGTVTAVVAVAVLTRDLVVLAAGTLGAVLVLPMAMTRWFPDSVAGSLLLVVVGVLLVGIAVRMTRGPGRRGASGSRRDWTTGSRRPAVVVASGVVVAVVATVLVVAAG